MGKLALFLIIFSLSTAQAYVDVDILHKQGSPDIRLVVLQTRNCVDVLEVTMSDLEQEDALPETELKHKGPITKWILSHKKMRDAQKYDCKK